MNSNLMRSFFVVSSLMLNSLEAYPVNKGAGRVRHNKKTGNQKVKSKNTSGGGSSAGFLALVFGGVAAVALAKNKGATKTKQTTKTPKSAGHLLATRTSSTKSVAPSSTKQVGFAGPDRIGFVNSLGKYEGKPYVWDTEGPNTFDCTGFITHVLQEKGCLSDNVRLTSDNIPNYLPVASVCKPGDIIRKPGHAAFAIAPGRVYGAVGGSLDEVTTHSYSGTCYSNPCFNRMAFRQVPKNSSAEFASLAFITNSQ